MLKVGESGNYQSAVSIKFGDAISNEHIFVSDVESVPRHIVSVRSKRQINFRSAFWNQEGKQNETGTCQREMKSTVAELSVTTNDRVLFIQR